MKYNSKVIGSVCGILSAVAYGTNPLFGLPLYERGLTTSSVLFYRFLSSMIILFCCMLIRKESFRLERKQIIPMISGGLFMILSCFFLYLSLHLLESGIALTLLFIYPLMVCAIMYLFFHVKQSRMTICGMILGTAGIILLSAGHSGGMISKTGLVYILLSALVYAVYMVMVKVTCLKTLSPVTTTFYVLVTGVLFFLIVLRGGADLQKLPDPASYGYVLGLAVCPSILSFLLMTISIRDIGPTKTAILGALEPVSGLIFGVTVFHEVLSFRQMAGILIILGTVILVVISGKPEKRNIN